MPYNPVGVDQNNRFPTSVVSNAADTILKAQTAALIRQIIGAASPSDVSAAVAGLIDSSPAALDTLKELSSALGNDPNFSSTVMTAVAARYTKPNSGIPKSDLVSTVQTSLDKAEAAVQGSGVTRVEKMTQAAYDSLTTKSATTLYVIVG